MKLKGIKIGLLLFSVCTHQLFAQSYFQQEVNYTINVALNDVTHELNADEKIEYINNSPNSISEIYMHMWPNAYKNNATALAKQFLENGETKFYYSKEEDRGFISGIDFKVNGEAVKFVYDSVNIDMGKITLNSPLAPGQKLIITTPFHVKIPIGIFSRLGHMGQQYQITQWYPKPAVYDANGWNAMPYLNQGEFYSEFGSFDVSISLPENYVVGATGDLVDGEKEIAWLTEKAKITESIREFNKSDNSFPASSDNLKTLRYKQSNVHDFAWFADKRYHVLTSEVELPQSKRMVSTWVMFTNAEAHLWKKSIPYINDALYYYSLWNGDYPYNQCTAVDGALSAGGGMEYPNVSVIGASGKDFILETTIMHEVGHNWFYGILGSNERIHPWMDEGLNSFNELRYMRKKYPSLRLLDEFAPRLSGRFFNIGHYKQKAQYELSYLINARRNLDQKIELPAAQYTELNYGGVVYSKTALVFDYLMAYIGEEKMNKIMHRYFDTYKFKHPQPNNLRKIIEEETEKPMTWFFDGLINSTKKLDYKIIAVKERKDFTEITIKNVNNIKGPVCISAVNEGKVIANVWYDGFYGKRKLSFPPENYDSYRIDGLLEMPEINRKNNTIRTKGLFKKVEPLRLQFLGSVENPDKTQICYLPVVGYNVNNSFMPGIAIYNNPFPQKKLEYFLMPLYSAGTSDYAGQASIAYNWFLNNDFQNIRLSCEAMKYAIGEKSLTLGAALLYNYKAFTIYKLTPQLSFELKRSNSRSSLKQNLFLRSINIYEEFLSYNYPILKLYNSIQKNTINEISYNLKNSKALTPYSLNVVMQQNNNSASGSSFMKLFGEFKYRFVYKKKGKGFDIRLFVGKFIYNNEADSRYGFGMEGGSDYTYDQILLGRNVYNGMFQNQLISTDGGFKHQTGLLFAQNWLTSVHFQSSIPKIPLALYTSAGATDVKNYFVYETGVALVIIPKVFEVYFPIYLNNKTPYNVTTYTQYIRFALNLNLIKPFQFARGFTL